MLDCAFCRTPIPDNDADKLALVQARVAKKDPVAINHLGEYYYFGEPKDTRRAVELWTEAAELGSVEALYQLGVAHYNGEGVPQDEKKAVEYYNKAAMHGHVECRHNLGYHEAEKGDHDRAVRHYLISAKMGHKDSVEAIKEMFTMGLATKEQYAEAMEGYRDAVEEMKSHDRDEVKRITRKKR